MHRTYLHVQPLDAHPGIRRATSLSDLPAPFYAMPSWEPSAEALLAVPLFHITALAMVFLWCMPSGAELHMMHKWDAGLALELIRRHRITRFTGVPTMVRDMLEHPTFTPDHVASIRAMSAGGAPVPPSQVARGRRRDAAFAEFGDHRSAWSR